MISIRPAVLCTSTFLICSAWAAPAVTGKLAHTPLRFETTAEGNLAAREGAYRLLIAPGQTTVTVSDRTQHRSASVVTKLAGADASARPEGVDPMAAKANYLLGSDPTAWRTAALYQRARYRGVYPGIDLVFHGTSGSLEYDFVVEPGGNAGRIALDVSGADRVAIEADGSLAIATAAGGIRWNKPEVYQMKNGARQRVEGAFALKGHRVTFALGAYDHSRELVIDPTLVYATYNGGSDNEAGRSVAVDSSGNIYTTGFSFSGNLPKTSGSFQSTYKGGTFEGEIGGDAFVAKYTSAGALVYVTYLGGSGDDTGLAIATDAAGNAYVVGETASSNFPTTSGAFQTKYGGGGANLTLGTIGDAFVTKLNPTGTALVYSTYLGGSADEVGTAIAVDSAGNAYVGGSTRSANFPVKNANQATYKGTGGNPDLCTNCGGPMFAAGDGFVAKLNAAGSDLVWATYLGGSLDDVVTTLALDASSNVYVGGTTLSSDFPTLAAYQSKYGGAASSSAQPVLKVGDAFISKFDTNGKLTYSTYLGGSGDDAIMALTVDSTGAVYATGFTTSADLAAAGVLKGTFHGPTAVHAQTGFVYGDAFVAKLAPSGASLVYATFIGGNNDDAGWAIAVDSLGEAIVGGFANSRDLATTADAVQKTFGGTGNGFTDPTGDAMLVKLSADGATVLYASYFGGSSDEAITGLAIDGSGNVIVTGPTTSNNLPTTNNAAQRTYGGQNLPTETTGDAFMAIFSGLVSTAPVPVITNVTNGATLDSRLAPGTAANVFGTNLPTTASAGALVGGKSVTVGVATLNQWTIIIPPTATAGATTVQIGTSAPFNVTLAAFAPALFSTTSDGKGAATAVHTANTGAITAASPALPGETVAIYATGLGPTGTGGAATGAATVNLAGTSITPVSVIATLPGLYEVRFVVAANIAAGNQNVSLTIGGLTSNTLTLPVGAVTVTGPVITSVQNGASFADGFAPNAWVTIKGSNLSTVASDTWDKAIVNGALPTTLDGVTVTIGGLPAYVDYVSPGQINVVAPNVPAGSTTVVVKNSLGTSASFTTTALAVMPAFFVWPGGQVVASHNEDFTYAVKNGTFGVPTVAAHPGDILVLWGTGFGPTTPPAPTGVVIVGSYAVNGVTVTVGGIPAQVYYTILASPFAALFQVGIQVPTTLADGDYPIVAAVSGASSPSTLLLTVKK